MKQHQDAAVAASYKYVLMRCKFKKTVKYNIGRKEAVEGTGTEGNPKLNHVLHAAIAFTTSRTGMPAVNTIRKNTL